ncbi:biotin--[acetyl-CoA-carboxylase] ligase [Thermodesulfatator autotrophicus]|uniref:biotin--[biotin carboxyl-carrier protein] ligase n=1 Tax=Thermodesulfatator autotrophicus TaxID=1795632 RepID=A0A177E857_9BACT|nr:biotin--[acetyl-CoA-carboxylase] ligase [Thermodesulfatator autotrophicus]OAG28085.1 hypothetical protein TH606_03365 [Thermodesulfatator autotrophicus]
MSGINRHKIPSFSQNLPTKWLGKKLLFFKELSSTQDEIKKRALSEPSGLVVWADRQTKGRGRLSRSWYSPRGAGLYFSILLKEPLAQPVTLYSLATAIGVAQGLDQLLNIPVQLKWPNDILLRQKKIGGILLEKIPSGLIIGIGLNVSFKKEDLPPEIREKATSIFLETGLVLSRPRLLKAILVELEKIYEKLKEKGFSAIEKAWLKRDVVLGSRVVLKRGEEVITGQAVGLTPEGNLLIEANQDLITISSGEIVMWEISGWHQPKAA